MRSHLLFDLPVRVHHALAARKVALPDSGQPITFLSAHPRPNGPEARRREAAFRAAPISDLSGVAEAYTIDDAESFATARDLLRREGIMAGSSSGTLVTAALRYCRGRDAPERGVTFICDSDNKYLSKMCNDFWMQDQGFLERCRIFALAESLGGFESLIEHPAIMTHASLWPEVRRELGIGDNLVRLSVGIEAAEDLIADLAAALG